jgi:PAS domain S-box-containing protein
MMRVWSQRPQFLHLGLFFAAYVLGCGFAQSLAIVPGTGISIWPPGGLFMATLVLASWPSWPWWVLVGFGAELFGNVLWFHSPLPAAVLIYVGNALAAAAGAWLVNWTCRRPVRLETLRDVLAFVVLGAGVAPVISATVGSATLAWFEIQSQSFAAAWPLWWIGDATGILIVAPLALVVLQDWGSQGQLSAARWMEACVLGLILLGVTALSFSGYLPFAYIIMPPLLWAAVRFEFKGAAATLILLALITAVFTVSGASQFAGDPESQRQKHVMLQLFLAVSALSALIVAAISRQHQQALLTLRQSEQKLRQLIDTVPALIWSTTRDGTPSYINKRLMDAVGVTLEDLIAPDASRSLADVHPADRCVVEQALSRSFETGDAFAMTYRQRRSDEAYRWTEGRAEALRDESGGIVQWYGVCVDIDDMVTAQEALRHRERELSQLVDMVPSLLWRLSPDGEPIFFNKRMIDFLGLDVADADKSDSTRPAAVIKAVVHPDDAARVTDALSRSLATGERFSLNYRLRRADGVYRWMSGRAEPMRDHGGRIVQWYGLSHDIDDQMRAEQALRERERQLQQLIDALPTMIWAATPEGEPSYINKRLTDYVGLTLSDLDVPDISRLQAAVQGSVHPDDAAAVQQALVHSFGTGEAFVMKYRQRRADGVYRWIQGRAEPLRDPGGRIVQWYGVSFDIYEEVTAQQALRERERFLWQLVETLPAMIDCAAPDGEPIYRSQQLREFLGYELQELDGSGKSRLNGTLDAGVHPDDVAGVKEQYAHSLSTGEPYARKHRLRRFDGEYRWVETRAAPMRNAEGVIVQWNVICLDIDGEVRMQEELRLAQEKMARASQAASLAELSASIAHEVNQPLAAIVATSHACRRWLSANPPNLERAAITLERIIRDANSASEVVSRIRALFSQMGKARSPADLTEVIAEVCRLMADQLASKNIRIEAELDRSLPPALIDRIQIQQVLVNLIRNAIDSMDTAVGGSRLIRLRAVLDGDNAIRLEVSDLGAGMKEPERAFEPFVTTKENGMGMGLAICRSIIEAHDGRLWATRNEPRGTTLAFTLPVQARDAA